MQRKNNHTSTLFHYTKSKSFLLSIIKDGFKYSYCKEEFMEDVCLGIPMVSFCDIPIGSSTEHVSKYGSYAIGISKEALIKVGVEPVNYFISENSTNSAFYLKEIAKKESETRKVLKKKGNVISYQKGETVSIIESPTRENVNEILDDFYADKNYYKASISSIGFMKKYSFKNKKGKIQINYDENEWRIVLPEERVKKGGCKWFWNKEEYDIWRSGVKYKFVQNWILEFGVEDIDFIIVPKQKDIPDIICKLSKVKHVCGKALTEESRNLLLSKIISFEQIKNDF